MKVKEIRDWLFTNNENDQWWVWTDEGVSTELWSLDEVLLFIKQNPNAYPRILHVTMSDMESPPWITIERKLKAPLPSNRKKKRPSYRIVSKPKKKLIPMRPKFPTNTQPANRPLDVKHKTAPTRHLAFAASLITIVTLLGFVITYVSSQDEKAQDVAEYSDAYYNGKELAKNHLGIYDNVSFPPAYADSIFHERIDESTWRIHGYARVTDETMKNKIANYAMITRINPEGAWDLLYFKSGDIIFGTPNDGYTRKDIENIAKVTK